MQYRIIRYNNLNFFLAILLFIGISFSCLDVVAQNTRNATHNTQNFQYKTANTAELIQQIKTLMAYRSVKLNIDYSNLPITLVVNPKNFEALNSYSAYLKQTFENGGFTNFSETCFNHIASRKITNPKDSSLFNENPSVDPDPFD